jgi:hypothetical protein
MLVTIIITIAVVGLLFYIGTNIGKTSPDSVGIVGGTSPPPDSETCNTNCNQWLSSRAARCTARSNEASALTRFNNLSRASMVLSVAIGVALGAVVVASLVPIIGSVLMAIALGVVASLTAALIITLGAMLAAETDLTYWNKEAQAAAQAETRALALISQNCSEEERNKCLSLPSPC